MRMLAGCLLAALVTAVGCLDLHGIMPAQPEAKKPAAASRAAPARPPLTEDQVTEANAAAAVQALTEELNRADRGTPD